MGKPKYLLIGKNEVTDYAGSRTLYMYNALSACGVQAEIYDIHSGRDVPGGCTHVVWLPWMQTFDAAWSSFIGAIGGMPIAYADNYHWLQDCRQQILKKERVDIERSFTLMALASSEGIRWWPRGKYVHWGAVVDEELAKPRAAEDYLYVDEVWPAEWSSGIYSAAKILDIAIPRVKERIPGLLVVSQRTQAPWVDQLVGEKLEVEEMLQTLAGARAFVTTHEEAMGWMQIEALMCGVPVITNAQPEDDKHKTSIFTKHEVMKAGDECIWTWSWPTTEPEQPSDPRLPVDDPEQAADSMVEAICAAIERADRTSIRQRALSLYGREEFVRKCGALIA